MAELRRVGDYDADWHALLGRRGCRRWRSCLDEVLRARRLPLAPLESYYLIETGKLGVLSGGRGFKIPTNAKSVLAGYARTGLFLFAAFSSVSLVRDGESGLREALNAGAACLLWLVSQFVFGRASSKERLRRRLLRAGAGVGIPPLWMDTYRAPSTWLFHRR